MLFSSEITRNKDHVSLELPSSFQSLLSQPDHKANKEESRSKRWTEGRALTAFLVYLELILLFAVVLKLG